MDTNSLKEWGFDTSALVGTNLYRTKTASATWHTSPGCAFESTPPGQEFGTPVKVTVTEETLGESPNLCNVCWTERLPESVIDEARTAEFYANSFVKAENYNDASSMQTLMKEVLRVNAQPGDDRRSRMQKVWEQTLFDSFPYGMLYRDHVRADLRKEYPGPEALWCVTDKTDIRITIHRLGLDEESVMHAFWQHTAPNGIFAVRGPETLVASMSLSATLNGRLSSSYGVLLPSDTDTVIETAYHLALDPGSVYEDIEHALNAARALQ